MSGVSDDLAHLWGKAVALSADDLAELPKAWDAVRRPELQDFGPLRRALERYRFAMSEQRASDRILDAMIAAEALVLAGIPNEELGFRFALQCAWLLSRDDSAVRRRLFDRVRRAYNVRSKLAHGDMLEKKHMARDFPPETQARDLSVLVEEYSWQILELVRLILVEAVRTGRDAGKQELLDWTTLIVGPTDGA
jgi:hypothetical protein